MEIDVTVLDKNWREAATKHYSTWALYVICAVVLIPEVLFYGFGIDTNPIVWGRWLIATSLFGLIGKFIIQTERHKWKRRWVITIVIALSLLSSIPALAATHHPPAEQKAFELIARWEGKRNHSYQDIVGVWTICYGHTHTARPGQYKTDDECRNLLIREISEYREALHVYFASDTKINRLPPLRDAAYTSLAFNIGPGRAGRSTATRRLNKGDVRGGCEALTWWNRAGGRVVRGLVRRRSEEREYCLRRL